MKELIERLKKNKIAFGLLLPEEQECFRKVEKKNCLYFEGAIWHKATTPGDFFHTSTYTIKPDYQPEPEYVDLEIEEHEGYLGINRWGGDAKFLPFEFTHLHCLCSISNSFDPSLPNFEKFWCGVDKDSCFIEDVARKMSEGKKVYARFRK